MNVSLTPELEKWVESKVETGSYSSSSEVGDTRPWLGHGMLRILVA